METFNKSSSKLLELQTAAFFDTIFPEEFRRSHGLGDNAIEQRHIIIYGRQGVGKTNCVNWLVQQAVIRYGKERVNVQSESGENFGSLLVSRNWTNQPVQILVVEDLTNVTFKRHGGEIRDFFLIRHIMAQRTGLMEGICLVIFTCHRYHDTPISFRSDYDGLIVLSAPTNDFDLKFIERKVTQNGIEILDKAESDGRLGVAVVAYRRSLLGFVQIPLASPVETGHKEAPVPYAVTYSTPQSTHVTQDLDQDVDLLFKLETNFRRLIDELVVRWENWNPKYNSRANSIFIILGLAGIFYGLTQMRIGIVIIGTLWLTAAYLYWRKSKR
ncbi:MAG: hypothetical protein ABSE39_04515 [Candidatus Bathyarchaeia archaeon]|jgi:hypothetical protein